MIAGVGWCVVAVALVWAAPSGANAWFNVGALFGMAATVTGFEIARRVVTPALAWWLQP